MLVSELPGGRHELVPRDEDHHPRGESQGRRHQVCERNQKEGSRQSADRLDKTRQQGDPEGFPLANAALNQRQR
jgi:hypothetical protein